MYQTEHYEYGILNYHPAGVLGVALSATHVNGEHKLRLCEDRDEVRYYQLILRDWLQGIDRDENKYHNGRWGPYYEDESVVRK